MKDYSESKIPRLFELMEKRNIKAKDIVQATDITAASFTDWRKGNMPSPAKLKTLAEFFNVPVEYLLGQETDASAIDIKIQAEMQQMTEEQKEELLKYAKYLQID